MTERSHWGWGLASKFPDRDARINMGKMVQAMLGMSPHEPRDPISLDAIEPPPSTLDQHSVATTDDEERIRHTYGRSFADIVRGFSGDFSSAPDLVALPKTEQEVVDVLEFADRTSSIVIPFGGGTSVVGGVNPGNRTRPTISLDLRHFDVVSAVDPLDRIAQIGAGALGPELEATLKTENFTLRHYPQSFEFSTLGGWLATHAGGHFATQYTHIDDFCEAMRIVTPRGTIETAQVPRSGAGPHPKDWFLGSEGTLGVITSAWMRVQPRPTFKEKATATFAEFSAAVAACREVAQSGMTPSNCRLLDSREAMLNQVVTEPKNVLIVGFESAVENVSPRLDCAVEILKRHGADIERSNSQGADTWRSAFIDAPYLQTILVSMGMVVDTFETSCRWSVFDAFHEAMISEVRDEMKTISGAGFISCRFTHVYPDGPAPYYTFVLPSAFGRQIEDQQRIKERALAVIQRFGASPTHHHAVGTMHRDLHVQQLGVSVEGLHGLKNAFDPGGVMNDGVLF